MSRFLLGFLILIFCSLAYPETLQSEVATPALRIICFGAHPDDAEYKLSLIHI